MRLAVLNALFRWLVEQRYVLANPFAGIKLRGSQRAMAVETTHAFTEGEWLLVRTIANGLEWSYAWQAAARQVPARLVPGVPLASSLRTLSALACR